MRYQLIRLWKTRKTEDNWGWEVLRITYYEVTDLGLIPNVQSPACFLLCFQSSQEADYSRFQTPLTRHQLCLTVVLAGFSHLQPIAPRKPPLQPCVDQTSYGFVPLWWMGRTAFEFTKPDSGQLCISTALVDHLHLSITWPGNINNALVQPSESLYKLINCSNIAAS